MSKLMISFLTAASLFTFAGCKKKGGAGDVLEKMEGFSKQMCDCKDKACADKVNEDMTKWGTEMAKTAGKDEKPDPELAKKSADIMTKYTECMTKLMMAGATPPAEPTAKEPAADDKKEEPAAADGDKKEEPAAADGDKKEPAAADGDKKEEKKEGGW